MSNPTSTRVAAGLIGVALAAEPSYAATAPAFRPAVEEHIAAIARRDLPALIPTLTRGAALTMIMPNGVALEARQQYVDFHRNWFATPDEGRLDAEIVRTVESPALAHALIRYRYSSRDPAGATQGITSWLALTFALEDGRWRLVFDQNTAIVTKPGT